MPDYTELDIDRLTVDRINARITELRQRGEELLIEQRTLIGVTQLLRELSELTDAVTAKVHSDPGNREWSTLYDRLVDIGAAFAMGEVWRSLTQETSQEQAAEVATQEVTPVMVLDPLATTADVH